MGTPPPRKRQRRLVVLSSDDELESPAPVKVKQNTRVQGIPSQKRSLTTSRLTPAEAAGGNHHNGTLQLSLTNLPTRPSIQNRPPPPGRSINSVLKSPSKASSVPSTRTTPTSSPEKKRKTVAKPKNNAREENVERGDKSLRNFFQPATAEERWSRLQREKEREKEKEKERHMFLELENDILEDMIEDDDSLDEILSQPPRQNGNKGGLAGFHGYPALDRRKSSLPSRDAVSTGKLERKPRPAKRFILHADGNGLGPLSQSTFASLGSSSTPAQTTARRPWAEQFAPVNLDELAVHKRKVSDVQNWLNEVFAGRSTRHILVLKGPAGSGKTTTVSLLSKVLGYDIVEWRNPARTEYPTQEYASTWTQFDDFLGRCEKYNCLDLDGEPPSSAFNNTAVQSSRRRVILVEEFPPSLSPGSSGLIAFRSALQRHAASALPSVATRTASGSNRNSTTPVIIIVSEALLGDGASLSDHFTAHRLLGPELSNHPGISIIEFNPIAPTFLTKALDLVLKKEARLSQRKRIPGPGVLKRFAKMGDVRSAISSLEFICLRGGDYEGYSGTVNSRPKRSGQTAVPPTAMEIETLEMVTQREASLGIFHAVGKIMYNKRDDASSSASTRGRLGAGQPASQPRDHHHLVSQVSVEDLMNETGTDIQTFLSALHENYPPSCHGDLFTESFDGCSEQLSSADVLGIGNRMTVKSARGLGSARITFHGAGTGIDILRQDEISFQVASRGLLFHLPYPVNRRGPDAHKMFYPSSLKLWRQSEEVDGLVSLWMRRITTATMNLSIPDEASRRSEGVESWGNRARLSDILQDSGQDSYGAARCMVSRGEAILERLPYMRLISKDTAERKEIERVTQLGGSIRRSQEIEDLQFSHDIPSSPTRNSPGKNRKWQARAAASGITGLPSVEEAVDKLVLSDDDIEDD
ncbi:RFC checkpoint protein Rad17 [Microsporum audouinii]